MKITTRINTGYGIFIAVLVGLAAYQIITVNRMQSINQDLKDINAPNALISLQAMQDRDLIEEFTRKSFFLVDPDYTKNRNEYIADFDAKLKQLESGVRSEAEINELRRLKQSWDAFNGNLERIQRDLPEAGLDALPESLLDDLEALKIQTSSVYDAIMRSMSDKLDQSVQTSRTVQVVLVSLSLVVLSITILVSLLIVRSISKPLAHLTEGTRAITEGKYFYRLDTSRDDEFAQLAKDFNTMIRRLSELDELKKDFISHVSHELKSPLASMRETVRLMIDEIPGPLTEKQKRLLELNLRSGDRLTSMIRNLLDLGKIEAGTMEYNLLTQDLVSIVREAIAGLEVRAEEKQVRIETVLPESPMEVKCDRDRIVQVLVNLLDNAVKFSPNGTVVRVRLGAVSSVPETMPQSWRERMAAPEPPGNYALISIVDSGPGIADQDKNRIFEKFHQIKKGEKVEGQGVGLGLAICRTIVTAHRGAVWVEDAPGRGSWFLLLLSAGMEEDVASRASQPI
ncbi:MAG: HAMP domain-containing histidine kinase [Acidobacteria bacterium]|nr:HAMP domain-containing histidine kinase [Acidobacteriota bacterium]